MSKKFGAKSNTWARSLSGCNLLAMLILGNPAPAAPADIPSLLTQKHCNGCHDVSAVRVGPPFLAVAIRYRADKDRMVDVLARKIVLGGGGNWGVVPMVTNDVTPAEARAIAEWVLSLNPPG